MWCDIRGYSQGLLMRCLDRHAGETNNNKAQLLFLLLARSRLARQGDAQCLIDGNSYRKRSIALALSNTGLKHWKK